MASTGKKVIAVIGGTGHQGVSVIRAIMTEGDKSEFSVRAITKDSESETAKWLKKSGADVRDVDVNDENALTEALKGCYGMYAVTFFWQTMNPEEEMRQARNMANAAKKNNLKHVVWSTLEDTRELLKDKSEVPTLGEQFKVPPFDAKAEADRYFADSGIPTTYFVTPFYWENFIDMGMNPRKSTGDAYEIALPMGKKRLGGMSVEDVGRIALTLFKKPEEWANKRLGVMSEALTVDEIATKMSKVLGKTIRYKDVDIDEYRRMNFPGARELANMFYYYQNFEDKVLEIRCPETARKLYPNVMNFDQWLNKYKDHIPLRG
jgi:uncharacterized protein YbjT (DUF2867 family)